MSTTVNFSDLFNQGSTQLNFLLLSQRNMILIFAFSLTFMVFASSLKHRYMVRFILLCLLFYSVALGIVSIINYNNYIRLTRRELNSEKGLTEIVDDELQILNDWGKWVYFSYALLGINALIVIFYIMYELGIYHVPSSSSSSSPKVKETSLKETPFDDEGFSSNRERFSFSNSSK